MKKIKILFVCSGNIFRSMSAEYCLKQFLEKNKIDKFEVSSAGLTAKNQALNDDVKEILDELGIDVSKHKQRRLNDKIIKENDLIVAMGENHKLFLKENFDLDVPLFNEIAYNHQTGLLDNNEINYDWNDTDLEYHEYNQAVVKYIHNSIPYFYANLHKFNHKINLDCIFCDLIKGKKKKHNQGYPFLILHETKNTISFLSQDIPLNKDSHILVITKEHYSELENIPKNIRHELIDHVALAATVLKRTHGACNILQNDGKSAGQCIFHVHFHIIPRDKNDGIEIELWDKGEYPLSKFKENHKRLKKEFDFLSN